MKNIFIMFVVMMLCVILTACNQQEDEIVSHGFSFQENSKETSDSRIAYEIKRLVSFQNDVMIRLYFGHSERNQPIKTGDELLKITAQNGDSKEVLFTSTNFFFNNEFAYKETIKNGRYIITFIKYVDVILSKKLFINSEGIIRFSIINYFYDVSGTSTDGQTIELNYKMINNNSIKFSC